ncbi:MAG: Flp pilus assembly complex ATPase component TadA [Candidatus Lokiarchaeota archaeon]|nr:Flp pilus assembly complex ATPase component TadA [Candidatus Lokiarchaeota archaeon]
MTLDESSQEINRIVPDTSVIISGVLADREYTDPTEILIPRVVLSELEYQANLGKATGYVGLNEIKKLKEITTYSELDIKIIGERPGLEQIKLATGGELDELIRQTAKEYNATLVTSDKVQALVAEIEGIRTEYVHPRKEICAVDVQDFFTSDTMSVHLREGVPPMAKRGTPGKWYLEQIDERPMKRSELQNIATDLIERAKTERNSFVEVEEPGATVLQVKEYRIVITHPPFSDKSEVTLVRPIVTKILDDYELSERLRRRIEEQAEGIIIAGRPGSGKSTFVQAIANLFAEKQNVATLERPRDLQVGPTITQYAPLGGDFEKAAELLLLIRPDFVAFDEMRRTVDFRVFADFRMAGVGMLGVVHTSRPVDAIQRLIGRIELGIIPQIVDTVIYMDSGQIECVYYLKMVVKVPSGMFEADLARPIIEIRDFDTDKLLYELYTFGEQVVVIPISSTEKKKVAPKISEEQRDTILSVFGRYVPYAPLEIEPLSESRIIVRTNKEYVPQIIGKNGEKIKEIEQQLGIRIDVREAEDIAEEKIALEISVKKKFIMLRTSTEHANGMLKLYVNGKQLLTAKIGAKGVCRIRKTSKDGKRLIRTLHEGKRISATEY